MAADATHTTHKPMTEREQQIALESDLDALLHRYVEEFNLSISSAIGVLEIVKLKWVKAVLEDEDDE